MHIRCMSCVLCMLQQPCLDRLHCCHLLQAPSHRHAVQALITKGKKMQQEFIADNGENARLCPRVHLPTVPPSAHASWHSGCSQFPAGIARTQLYAAVSREEAEAPMDLWKARDLVEGLYNGLRLTTAFDLSCFYVTPTDMQVHVSAGLWRSVPAPDAPA